jgi:indole-3-glycerol phosphate synthase
MNILKKILLHKADEVKRNKELYPVRLLENSIYFQTQPVSLKTYLRRADKVGIIAEIKRKSPSRGVINNHVSIEKTSIGYMQAGASALSVLTDNEFFGGRNEDLTLARKYNYCPILRKDFIIDEYQLVEAKSIGADVVLLIAAALEPAKLRQLAASAKALGLEVLLEVTSREEVDNYICPDIDVVGINNRNLNDFTLNLDLSFELGSHIPADFLKISESAISKARDIVELKKHGFNGFLIGKTFMKHSSPEKACAELVEEVQSLLAHSETISA